jgi:hypothetical protein
MHFLNGDAYRASNERNGLWTLQEVARQAERLPPVAFPAPRLPGGKAGHRGGSVELQTHRLSRQGLERINSGLSQLN